MATGENPNIMDRRTNKRIPTITRDTVSWRLRDGNRSIDGALSQEQISRLHRDFGLDTEGLNQLSLQLDTVLAKELHLAQPEHSQARVEKGVRELQRAIKSLSSAESDILKVAGILKKLGFRNPYSYTGMPNPALNHLSSLEIITRSIPDLRRFLDMSARERFVFYLETPDRRHAFDVRRKIVCTHIFNFWEQSGRNLSYTTDPATSERGGPLIDFINTIVGLITSPPGRLSGDSIKAELDSFKAISSAR